MPAVSLGFQFGSNWLVLYSATKCQSNSFILDFSHNIVQFVSTFKWSPFPVGRPNPSTANDMQQLLSPPDFGFCAISCKFNFLFYIFAHSPTTTWAAATRARERVRKWARESILILHPALFSSYLSPALSPIVDISLAVYFFFRGALLSIQFLTFSFAFAFAHFCLHDDDVDADDDFFISYAAALISSFVRIAQRLPHFELFYIFSGGCCQFY